MELRDRLPEDFIVTLDAGNHTGWPQRFLIYRRPGRQVGPTSGAMGYSVPAAVAASLIHPDRLVIGCVGGGGFMMSAQELATAPVRAAGGWSETTIAECSWKPGCTTGIQHR